MHGLKQVYTCPRADFLKILSRQGPDNQREYPRATDNICVAR